MSVNFTVVRGVCKVKGTDHLIFRHGPCQSSKIRLIGTTAMAVGHEHAERLRVRSDVRLYIREAACLTGDIDVEMLRP